MDVLDILKNVDITFDEEQKLTFKKEFHKYYKSVQEIRKLKDKLDKYHYQSEMYKQKFDGVSKELAYLQNSNRIREKGVSEKYLVFVQAEVLQYVNEKTDFNTALHNFVKEHPQYMISTK